MNLEELARQAGYSASPMCGIAFPQHGAEDETELLARFAALVLEDAATRCDQVAAHTIEMDPKQGLCGTTC